MIREVSLFGDRMTSMKRASFLILLSIFFLSLFFVGGGREGFFGGLAPEKYLSKEVSATNISSADASVSNSRVFYPVLHVVDGDTIDVDLHGIKTRLRLIGINTPETVNPRRPIECFGREASAYAKELLSGKDVAIAQDLSQGEYDKYGRMLAYVFLRDGTFFNEQMIRGGYAYEYTYHFPYQYQEEFRNVERAARTAQRGLWAPNACGLHD